MCKSTTNNGKDKIKSRKYYKKYLRDPINVTKSHINTY